MPLTRSLTPTPILYKRNYLMRGDEISVEDDALACDVVTEVGLPDRAAYRAWLGHLAAPGSGVVGDDEEGCRGHGPTSSRNT